MNRLGTLIVTAVAALTAVPAPAAGFDPRVVTFGTERDKIKSLPIEKRPNRPLHVYGNTVRRRTARANTR